MARKTVKVPYVVVRTYSAGVHCGELKSQNGKEVVLTNARRIWQWRGANTLHEVANHGVGEGSCVSEPATEVMVSEMIEIITCTYDGEQNLRRATWSK